jgi:hypothetical protein
MNKISTGEAMKLRIRARVKRRQAEKISADDPLMAEAWIDEANEQDEQASVRLALTAPRIRGPGNEFAVPGIKRSLAAVISAEKPDAITTEASLDRIDLVARAKADSLALDLADSVNAKDSTEKLFAHREAVAHSFGMKLIEHAHQQTSPMWGARLANVAMRCFEVANDTALKLARLRNGGNQTFEVRYVNVAAGGQAIVGNVTTQGDGKKTRLKGARGGTSKNGYPHARSAGRPGASPNLRGALPNYGPTMPRPCYGERALPDARGPRRATVNAWALYQGRATGASRNPRPD